MSTDNWENGLPPVDEECEYLFHENSEWRKGLCVAIHQGCAVMVDGADDGAEICPPHRVRPIKKQEPKTGEVYLNRSGIPHVFGFCLAGGGHFGFMSLCGSMATIDDYAGDFEYAAPDVESYVARKFLTQQAEQERCYVRDIVKEAARLDED